MPKELKDNKQINKLQQQERTSNQNDFKINFVNEIKFLQREGK